jgi:hypothetical protein
LPNLALDFDIDAPLAPNFEGLQLNSLRDATGNFRVEIKEFSQATGNLRGRDGNRTPA